MKKELAIHRLRHRSDLGEYLALPIRQNANPLLTYIIPRECLVGNSDQEDYTQIELRPNLAFIGPFVES